MFKDEYQAALSKVTASEETYRRVMNMANKPQKRSGVGIVSKILIAAVMISMLAITASASEIVRSWFAAYFTKNDDVPISTEQAEFLEENEQNFNQSITADGFTMELKSAITDGEMAYICLGITAPENVVLNATAIEGYSTQKPTLLTDSWNSNFLTDKNGNVFYGYSSIGSVEDYDGLPNTQNLVIELLDDADNSTHTAFSSETEWTLHFENLIAKYVNDAYYEELMAGKYKNQENFFFTDEEAKQLYPEVLLAEGEWNFKIQFEEPDIREMELITEPVSTTVCMGWNANGDSVYQNVEITSFVLRSLSATVYTSDHTFAPDFTAEADIAVVMKDGSKVRLLSKGGSGGEQDFRAELPILLRDVDYVLLANGTRLLAAK